jgi:hypothetical protein
MPAARYKYFFSKNFLTAYAAGAVSFGGKRDAKPPAGSAGGAAQQNRTYISSTCSLALSPTRGMGRKLAIRKQAVLRSKLSLKGGSGKDLKDFISGGRERNICFPCLRRIMHTFEQKLLIRLRGGCGRFPRRKRRKSAR